MKLKLQRIKNKLSQNDLAIQSGVSKNKIARAELNDDPGAILKYNDLISIAKVLNCKVDDLVGSI